MPVASTILRATQFHEFPSQMIGWTRDGDHAQMFDMPGADRRRAGAVISAPR